MKKFLKKNKLYIFLILFILFIVNIVFIFMYLNKGETYLKNTYINGVDCSGLTVSQAKEKIVGVWNKNEFIINEANGKKEKIILSNVTYNIDEQLSDIVNPGYFSYILHKTHLKENKYTITMTVKETSDEFNDSLKNLSILEDKKDVTKTQNAYIDLNSSNYEIVKEVYGTNVDSYLLKKDILKLISNGEFTLNYDNKNYYDKPEIVSTSAILKQEQEYLKNLDLPAITYKMANKDVKIDKEQILKLYGITNKTIETKMKENKLTVDKSAVKSFVNDLAAKYNTSGRMREFKSTLSGTISITGGDYGYVINKDKEITKLTSELNKKKDINRKPCYSQTPYDTSDEVGDSYVEIDLTNQKLWVYKDGKKIVTSDIVTGDVAGGYSTPAGIYYLKYKQRDTTLSGSNADGSTYNSPVSYWMPFNGGIGMHDATWRSKFGGTIYKNSGSHGCINMPKNNAKKTYETIETNYPIVVHY